MISIQKNNTEKMERAFDYILSDGTILFSSEKREYIKTVMHNGNILCEQYIPVTHPDNGEVIGFNKITKIVLAQNNNVSYLPKNIREIVTAVMQGTFNFEAINNEGTFNESPISLEKMELFDSENWSVLYKGILFLIDVKQQIITVVVRTDEIIIIDYQKNGVTA